jgi:hypothetical protein
MIGMPDLDFAFPDKGNDGGGGHHLITEAVFDSLLQWRRCLFAHAVFLQA